MRLLVQLFSCLLSGYLLTGCSILGFTRQLKVTLINESGMTVERAVIKFFNYEAPAYRGDSIIVKNIAPQKSMEVLYNLEQVEAFSELSCKVIVEFREKQTTVLERSLFTSEVRRIGVKTPIIVTIKSDTLLRNY